MVAVDVLTGPVRWAGEPAAGATTVADDLDTYARLRSGSPALVRSCSAVTGAVEVPSVRRP